jgi:hypothetical protein
MSDERDRRPEIPELEAGARGGIVADKDRENQSGDGSGRGSVEPYDGLSRREFALRTIAAVSVIGAVHGVSAADVGGVIEHVHHRITTQPFMTYCFAWVRDRDKLWATAVLYDTFLVSAMGLYAVEKAAEEEAERRLNNREGDPRVVLVHSALQAFEFTDAMRLTKI